MKRYLNQGTYNLLIDSIENGDNVSVFGLNLGEKLALVEDSAFLFYVVENLDRVTEVCDKLTMLGRSCETLVDYISPLTSEFLSADKYINLLSKLKSEEINTLIITPEVLAGRFPKNIESVKYKCKDDINITEFIKKLTQLNYKRVDLVASPGEFSVRGDIIDIYSLDSKPTRIFVDYDQIESIKLYNPITMLTTEEINEISIVSNSYFQVSSDDIDDVYKEYKLKFGDIYDQLKELRSNDYRLMLFDKNSYQSIFDFADESTIVFDGAKAIYDKLEDHIIDYNKKIVSIDKSLENLAKTHKKDIKSVLKFPQSATLIAHHYIQQANRIFAPQKVFSIRTLPAVNYYNYNDALILDLNNLSKQNYTIMLFLENDEKVNKFRGILDSSRIPYNVAGRMGLSLKNAINLIPKSYPLDVLLPDEKLAIISSISLLGKKKKVIESDVKFYDGDVPKKDDYVVHSYHGIGKCLGVETLKISNSQRDYVIIEYKNNDKLYLPVENIDQLSKYLGSEKIPTLNKIGGVEFNKTKAKVKSAVKKIAFDLIDLYKKRMDLQGFKYLPDDDIQERFENDFGFVETADQLKAIDDCKSDMQAGKIMDRLVCGDVGFGKTEVALRIAFKTIMQGKQVALLCPTTILSEQHFNTAKNRMANYGVKVEVLNRLKSPAEVDRIKKDISIGKVDLICGTHKLLASDIDYKNLGLLILDEEQKFGVADKEKIKNYRNNINVLTLSATPIPRTLNMSLIGVRDISVIETPPLERIPCEVQVIEYSDTVIKSAIERELARDGQVLVIYNRVETIYQFAAYLHNMIDNATISVAHGQMTDVELETEIMNLYSGKTQVLVSTTLIENGVDLPNANTLIVINADKLGLSQLYQLKGRIGRSDKDSYAYFTFDSRQMLTENAYKRLQAIQEFSGMGSGFKIALRDLEIRGAGSLLGLEQSGHIEKIGYNLYVQLLSESVKELRNENYVKKTDVRVETTLSAYLSHSYVTSSNSRMKMYRDIARIDTMEKMLEFMKNTEEVYGDLPSELVNLVKIAYIKNMCGVLGASRISIRDKAIIYLQSKENLTKNLIDITLDNYNDIVSINVSDIPTIEINTIKSTELLEFLINYLQLITNN